MKKNALLLIIILGLFTTDNLKAQETVPKEVLLNTLNYVNKLKLTNLETSKLMEYNKGYVDEVYDVLESTKSEQDQKEDLKILATVWEKDLIDMIGKSKTSKYFHLMEKELRLLVHKNKLLRYIY